RFLLALPGILQAKPESRVTSALQAGGDIRARLLHCLDVEEIGLEALAGEFAIDEAESSICVVSIHRSEKHLICVKRERGRIRSSGLRCGVCWSLSTWAREKAVPPVTADTG